MISVIACLLVLVLAAQIEAQIYGYGLGAVNGGYYGNYGAYPFADVRATTAYRPTQESLSLTSILIFLGHPVSQD
ncbi:hypothetical protein DAPPUDRAFT_270403 [Daphnia pulex]|uniref:Uncharacterized protein n=1 Tax=Daphnia pulex TaxID=6669 RepID=E9I0N4_DAPPU|nr:hypothetical protein DAPPUDRAFT_270403 [Daphnia pulex]|eukprot:EFX62446.1 hypothetical protein DAPPUDRAFT_270403 [Daphnia pulex]